eukprot:Pgem_evm1s3942
MNMNKRFKTSNEEWQNKHEINANGVPKHLYTDENPVTTLKGCGFKNKKIALQTIHLSGQECILYKRFWTIKTMRERASHHPKYENSKDMQEAVQVFDKW